MNAKTLGKEALAQLHAVGIDKATAEACGLYEVPNTEGGPPSIAFPYFDKYGKPIIGQDGKQVTKVRKLNQRKKIEKIKRSSYTMNEFLEAYHLSRTDLSILNRQHRGPKTHKSAGRLYISFEAAEAWRHDMEKELRVLDKWHEAVQEDLESMEAWRQQRMQGGSP